MSGAIPPLPNTPSWRGTQFKKHRDKFTFKNFDNDIMLMFHCYCLGVLLFLSHVISFMFKRAFYHVSFVAHQKMNKKVNVSNIQQCRPHSPLSPVDWESK